MSMRERIAQALLASESANEMAWNDLDLITRSAFLRDADAVLAAIRLPTDRMIAAGIIERHVSATPEAWNLATANIFTAMIDAAKEQDA